MKKELYKEYPCDVCGSKEAVIVPFSKKYSAGQPIHLCKNCGFIYVKKRRSAQAIADHWSKTGFCEKQKKGVLTYTAHSPLVLARHTYIADFIDKSLGLKNKLMCDVGAGEGQFLKIAKKNYGSKVFGIEPSAKNCKALTKMKIKNFNGTMEDYAASGKKDKFDILTMMWTLENTTQPNVVLEAAYDSIKTGGYIVIATGSRILVPPVKPLEMYFSGNPSDSHPSRFSENSLKALLSKNGFKTKFVCNYILDGICLCVVAQKGRRSISKFKDDYKKIENFFRKWNADSAIYKKGFSTK